MKGKSMLPFLFFFFSFYRLAQGQSREVMLNSITCPLAQERRAAKLQMTLKYQVLQNNK